MLKRRLRVGLLFGGRSCEHEVSVQSARSVLAAIDRNRYEVIPIGITKDGQWVRMDADLLESQTQALPGRGAFVSMLPDPVHRSLVALGEGTASELPEGPAGLKLDIVFPLLHGPYGEDGTVQGLLELAGIPYVGSGVLGSAVGMDKVIMKALFEHHGFAVPPYRAVLRRQWRANPDEVCLLCEAALPYPWFVKPANLGSSVGVCKVRDRSEFARAMDDAARFDRKLIVEEAIRDAREIEIAVLGNDEPRVSVAGEIVPAGDFYDYRAKYLDGGTELIVPAELPAAIAGRVRALALEAFRALDLAGLARVDFLVRRDDDAIFLSEVNTLPGFTAVSMYPRLWEASGLAYPRLIDRLLELALERHREHGENLTSYLS